MRKFSMPNQKRFCPVPINDVAGDGEVLDVIGGSIQQSHRDAALIKVAAPAPAPESLSNRAPDP